MHSQALGGTFAESTVNWEAENICAPHQSDSGNFAFELFVDMAHRQAHAILMHSAPQTHSETHSVSISWHVQSHQHLDGQGFTLGKGNASVLKGLSCPSE